VVPKGPPFQDQLIGGRLETVDGGLGQQGVGHLGDPLDGFAVGGDEGGGAAVPLDHQLIDVCGVQGVEGLQGKIVQLLRYRSNWTYPDVAIIPTRATIPSQ
jgi:hypothetical protein